MNQAHQARTFRPVVLIAGPRRSSYVRSGLAEQQLVRLVAGQLFAQTHAVYPPTHPAAPRQVPLWGARVCQCCGAAEVELVEQLCPMKLAPWS